MRARSRQLHTQGILTVALLGILSQAVQAQIFVDARIGDDQASGLPRAPLKTITKAVSRARPGERILLASGHYTRTSGERWPIRIGFDQDHSNLVISGVGGVTLDLQDESDAAFHIGNSVSGLRLSGLAIRGSLADGVVLQDLQGNAVEIERCRFESLRRGIHHVPGRGPTGRVVIQRNLFERIEEAVVEPDPTGQCQVLYNTFANCRLALHSEGVAARNLGNVFWQCAVGIRTRTTEDLEARFVANNLFANDISWDGVPEVPGNFAFDPKFIDADRSDYRPHVDSPLLDLGPSLVGLRGDLSGNPACASRGTLPLPDLGAHEHNTSRLELRLGGGMFHLRFRGTPQAPATIIASVYDGLIALPGGHTLLLDPYTEVPLSIAASLPINLALPADPVLAFAPIWFQGLELSDRDFRLSNAAQLRPTSNTTAIEEFFLDDASLDRRYSAGQWSNGSVEFGKLGGDGLHGEFDPTDGVRIAANIYEWSTDSQVIPAHRARDGRAHVVTDGHFRFSRMVIPEGVSIWFSGRNPVLLSVQGDLLVAGTIDINAGDMPEHNGNPFGQRGGLGGPGGGHGGRGAWAGNGLGADPWFRGGDGEDLRLLRSHVYASRALRTGGRGSVQFPLSGLQKDITFGFERLYSTQVSAGGGGGGHGLAGQVGEALTTYQNRTQDLGPPAIGGISFSLLPIRSWVSSAEHFLVGGSGGGGSGSNPFFALHDQPIWRSGSGGAGGGGAIRARVGGTLTVQRFGSIEARGGSGYASRNSIWFPGAGGGGSGGSITLQAARCRQDGSLDVQGGTGGNCYVPSYNVLVHGGNGGPGHCRLELDGPTSLTDLGLVRPLGSASAASLRPADLDASAGCQSLWYSSHRLVTPQWLRYEIEAETDAGRLVFSDDPEVGILATTGQPLQFYVQGARVDPFDRQPAAESIGPWRSAVGDFDEDRAGLNPDRATGLRFALVHDRRIAPSLRVTAVRIHFR